MDALMDQRAQRSSGGAKSYTHRLTIGEGAGGELGFFVGNYGSIDPIYVDPGIASPDYEWQRFLVPELSPTQARPTVNPPAGSTLTVEFQGFPVFTLPIEPPGLFWQNDASAPFTALFNHLTSFGIGNVIGVNFTINLP
jgi:hypothetical protein